MKCELIGFFTGGRRVGRHEQIISEINLSAACITPNKNALTFNSPSDISGVPVPEDWPMKIPLGTKFKITVETIE